MSPTTTPHLAVPGKRRKPLDVVAFLKRRFLLILIVGGLVASVLAPLLALRGKSSFTATGRLAIDPGKEPTLNGRERETIPGTVGDYTRTLLDRLTAGDVLLTALQSVPTNQWPSFLDVRRTPDANVGRLFKALKAKEVLRTYLMTVELVGESPHGLAPLLNAVLEAFVDKLRRELERQNGQRLAYLREERTLIGDRIAAERQSILDLAASVPNKGFLHESYTVHLSKLEQIQRLYWEAEAQRAEREGDLQRTGADRQALRLLSLQAYADERVADNFGINRIEQWTYEQLQSLRSTIDGLTTNNEDRTYVEMRMEAMNSYLAKYKTEVNDLTIRILTEKRDHDLSTDIIKSSNALAAASATSASLRSSLEQARQEASDTSEAIFKASDLSFTVTQLRDRLTALNNRIDDCEMESKAPLRLTIDRFAGDPDPARPSSNTRPQLAMLGILLAFALVAGAVLGFEILDDRIRGPGEVEAALGGSAPDPVPFLSEGLLERVLLDRPTGAAGTALRSLVVRLNRERVSHGARLFAFSAAGRDVGNTSLALNAAQGLACFVPRVLLLAVGTDGLAARSGAQPPPVGTPLSCGPDEFLRRLVRDSGRGVDLAVIAPNDSALASKIGLTDLLAAVRTRYDAVVLDLGTVPDDDLAFAALHAVDAAVFTVREDHTMYRTLRRALDAAVAAGVSSLTVLLNATRHPPADRWHVWVQRTLRPVTRLHRHVASRFAQYRRGQSHRPTGGTAL